MSHKHHNCDCKHENVKYCSTCRVVHCLDCNQEWSPKSQYAWQWNPYVYYKGNALGGNYDPNTTVKIEPTWQEQLDPAKVYTAAGGTYQGAETVTKCDHGN